MVLATVLKLRPVEGGRLPVSHGAFAFSAALDLLLRLSPELGHRLHQEKGRKPLTVGVLSAPRVGQELLLSSEYVYDWRLTGLAKRVCTELAQLAPGLGGVRIDGVVFTVEEVRIEVQDSYKGLFHRWLAAEPPARVTLEFLTPTTFRVGRIEEPLPSPRLVFGSLLRTWNKFAPEEVQLDPLALEEVALSEYVCRTRRVELGGFQTVGFVGRCTYCVPSKDEGLARLLGLLGEYAFYAGVGWGTTHGLGRARAVGLAGPERESQG